MVYNLKTEFQTKLILKNKKQEEPKNDTCKISKPDDKKNDGKRLVFP